MAKDWVPRVGMIVRIDPEYANEIQQRSVIGAKKWIFGQLRTGSEIFTITEVRVSSLPKYMVKAIDSAGEVLDGYNNTGLSYDWFKPDLFIEEVQKAIAKGEKLKADKKR